MKNYPKLDYYEIPDDLNNVVLPDNRMESLDKVVEAIPSALEKLKNIDGEVEKLEYYGELMEIASFEKELR